MDKPMNAGLLIALLAEDALFHMFDHRINEFDRVRLNKAVEQHYQGDKELLKKHLIEAIEITRSRY